MLKVDRISKDYGRFRPVRDVSFTLERGEVLGLLGANGAGKTTTLHMISGYFPPSTGRISFDGFDASDHPLSYKKGLGYLPEIPPLYPDMTVSEQLLTVCSAKGISRKKRAAEIDRVCGLTRIGDVKNRPVRVLSKGYRQRAGLAQALVASPGLLVLDEPVNGLDPQQMTEIRELIRLLGRDHAVIISSHILSEIASISTRILVLHQGRIAADSPADELINSSSGETVLEIRVHGERKRILPLIEALPAVRKVDPWDCPEQGCSDYTILPEKGRDIRREISAALCGSSGALLLMKMKNPTLEEVFLDLTGRRNLSGGDD